LFFVASAHAQFDGQRITANIPFEFTAGNISFPAGQYEFQRTGANLILIRDADGRGLFTGLAGPIQANKLPEKSTLKFAVVNGRHVLIQIWNERDVIGDELQYGHTYMEVAKQSTIHGIVTGRR